MNVIHQYIVQHLKQIAFRKQLQCVFSTSYILEFLTPYSYFFVWIREGHLFTHKMIQN